MQNSLWKEMGKRTEVYECLTGIFTCFHITFAMV